MPMLVNNCHNYRNALVFNGSFMPINRTFPLNSFFKFLSIISIILPISSTFYVVHARMPTTPIIFFIYSKVEHRLVTCPSDVSMLFSRRIAAMFVITRIIDESTSLHNDDDVEQCQWIDVVGQCTSRRRTNSRSSKSTSMFTYERSKPLHLFSCVSTNLVRCSSGLVLVDHIDGSKSSYHFLWRSSLANRKQELYRGKQARNNIRPATNRSIVDVIRVNNDDDTCLIYLRRGPFFSTIYFCLHSVIQQTHD
jgi:hypothetical protein